MSKPFELKQNHTGNKNKISISGKYSVENASELYQAILETYKSKLGLTLDLKSTTDADVSFFQIISSGKLSFLKSDLSFSVCSDIPDKLKKTANTLGINKSVLLTASNTNNSQDNE